MKKQLNYLLLLALSAGTFATTSAAQTPTPVNDGENGRIAQATYDPSQSGLLRLTDWDDHRRCDGDRDRDDRNCRDRDGDRYRSQYYGGNPYYGNGNGYYATPYRGRVNGWYDRNGYWHAYDRDRDSDRRRHDDDDRR